MPSPVYLSKSDFKVGRECPAKLWYKKRRYPNTKDDDAFMKYLAENGHLVGEIACLSFPGGHAIDTLDPEEAAAETARYLQEENVVLFEPLVRHDRLLARIDILEKKGDQCRLIEVKSRKTPDTFLTKDESAVKADWKPYLEDVAFQLLVARHAHPDLTFTPWLMLTDGDARAKTARLTRQFSDQRERRRCTVSFHGSEAQRVELTSFLTLQEVSKEVRTLTAEVAAAQRELTPLVDPDAPHPKPSLTAACAKCEYRVPDGTDPNGFRECWGTLADPDPHIFDLHKRDLLDGGGNRVLNRMIAEGRTSLYDVRDDEWACTDKPYRQRQAIQVEYTRRNEEWIDPALHDALEAAPYPLQFIDFEFDQPAVPHVPATGPWSRIAFQWSLHTISAPGAPCTHAEYLDTTAEDPHPGFLDTLRAALDLGGTVLVWSPAEAATLRKLITGRDGPGNQSWINAFLDEDGPLLDMEKLTKLYHFHPAMKGQTSIKKAFPPAWAGCRAVDTLPECASFLEHDADGQRKDPYKVLAERHPGFPVADGTGAILAYHALLDNNPPPEDAQTLRRQLLDYCRLDTLAMRVIWKYWEERLGMG